MELIDKREFVKTALDKNSKTLMIHIIALKAETSIHLLQIAQIAVLQWEKALIKILAEYSDYINVVFKDLAIELSENIGKNKYTIKLIEEKQPPYGLIYALSSMKLETLKTYIEIHLKTRFI